MFEKRGIEYSSKITLIPDKLSPEFYRSLETCMNPNLGLDSLDAYVNEHGWMTRKDFDIIKSVIGQGQDSVVLQLRDHSYIRKTDQAEVPIRAAPGQLALPGGGVKDQDMPKIDAGYNGLDRFDNCIKRESPEEAEWPVEPEMLFKVGPVYWGQKVGGKSLYKAALETLPRFYPGINMLLGLSEAQVSEMEKTYTDRNDAYYITVAKEIPTKVMEGRQFAKFPIAAVPNLQIADTDGIVARALLAAIYRQTLDNAL